MGDRGQILIEDTKVYLYAHWAGAVLKQTLKIALAKKWRWEDPEYLTRIIFDVMTEGLNGQETGFGIGTTKHGDLDNPLIKVNCAKNQVTISGEIFSFEDFIKHQEVF